MKIASLLLILLLFASVVLGMQYTQDYNNPMTLATADLRYCPISGGCGGGNSSGGINESTGDTLYWRLDGTNAPPSANWNMDEYLFEEVGGIGFELAGVAPFIQLTFQGASDSSAILYSKFDNSFVILNDTLVQGTVCDYNGCIGDAFNGSLQPAGNYITNNTGATANLTLMNVTNLTVKSLSVDLPITAMVMSGVVRQGTLGTLFSATAGKFPRTTGLASGFALSTVNYIDSCTAGYMAYCKTTNNLDYLATLTAGANSAITISSNLSIIGNISQVTTIRMLNITPGLPQCNQRGLIAMNGSGLYFCNGTLTTGWKLIINN